MAFQQAYTKEVFGQELVFDQAYFQITYIQGNKDSVSVELTVYNNREKENVIDKINDVFIPDVSDNAKNFYKQGYEYFKTKPEFKDAVDVLEEGQTPL